MRNHKGKILLFILIAVGSWWFWQVRLKSPKPNAEIISEVNPAQGIIQNFISTTGMILPKNRLEIKPAVAGRIDSILVKEGDIVKQGQTIAWMSSTERAALLDSAQGQGEEVLNYWKQIYKAIPLISPIDGTVIVAATQAGQTVTVVDSIIVLSDRLIGRAQVDETDIGKIKLGQKAVIILDAYPEKDVKAAVDHIYYESKTINNVTIYEVDLLPEKVPEFFRSGMNITINFVQTSKENILIIPLTAVIKEKDNNFVLVKEANDLEPQKRRVELGLADEKNVEILSGITDKDVLIVKSKKFSLPKNNLANSPFSPFGNRKQVK